MKKCLGCGEILQNENEQLLGYVVDMNMDYCKRCFQMTHYDVHNSHDFIPDNEEVIKQLDSVQGDYLWIMDIFDLDTSLNSALAKFYQDRECSIILNKCDLLTNSVNYERLSSYVLKRIHALNIKSNVIITRGINDDFVENFKTYVYKNRPVIFTGVANVGKSTIINQLLKKQVVTTNRYPATTIRINEIKNDEFHFYDSAGLWVNNAMVAHLTNKDLKIAVPAKRVRPTVFQLEDGQSLALGGLARIDIYNSQKATVVVYCSNLLPIHRCKKEKAAAYWQNHYEQMQPHLIQQEKAEDFKKVSFIHKGKADYFIAGLGFICVVSNNCKIDIYLPKQINVNKREAMI